MFHRGVTETERKKNVINVWLKEIRRHLAHVGCFKIEPNRFLDKFFPK